MVPYALRYGFEFGKRIKNVLWDIVDTTAADPLVRHV